MKERNLSGSIVLLNSEWHQYQLLQVDGGLDEIMLVQINFDKIFGKYQTCCNYDCIHTEQRT